MHIVIAPDSFKGSLTSIQASEVMKRAVQSVDRHNHVTLKPMADGGEGTLASMLVATGGQRITVACTGALGETIHASYGIIHSDKAIIECAEIAGLIQVPENKRHPAFTTTFGIGEVIKDALDRGCRRFVIALGGSATNDGGSGMLKALGMKSVNANGDDAGYFGKDVKHISQVSFDAIDSRLADADIEVACDVDNPLLGDSGATYVYGPQKGLKTSELSQYDTALKQYANNVESVLGEQLQTVPGSGAAGGLGFALLAIGGRLISGAELIADAMKLEKAVQGADVVLTGEGQSDEQTLYGKAPGYIADLAQKHHTTAVLISGSLDGDVSVLREKFSGCFSIVNKPMSLQECMGQAEKLLYEQTAQVIQLLHQFQR
ncbi:glycerate kinase [Lentibacillus persicus]|uniref:Glycerate kinase n=1 Tax=Lentibacillus persicus TaxID=640948 RepID=A0A1I1YU56_9BACI|nr:glycerate kinase [Lentibacillus persicus]SFE22528.1 glycerate kinase [Lentibacillus persicus]